MLTNVFIFFAFLIIPIFLSSHSSTKKWNIIMKNKEDYMDGRIRMKKFYWPWIPATFDWIVAEIRFHKLLFRFISKQKQPFMTTTDIARVAHEVNKSYCESIGDHSQKSWEEAEGWQKQSAIKGVQFALENPDAPPSAQHDSWTADKVKDGWVYGPVKNPDTKEHPCLVPYEELPLEQRTKDYLFQAVVKSLKENIRKNEFYSKFGFGEQVNVKLSEEFPAINGEVDAVSFSPGKVRYDVQTEHELLIRVDSALVGETTTVPQPL
jgi:hypothetical protein